MAIESNVIISEEQLDKKATLAKQEADKLIIKTDSDYEQACEMAKEIKAVQKQVKDYWEPLRVSAKKTYDDILDKKKQMLNPLEDAEKTLKSAMVRYTDEQEMVRNAQEAELKRLAHAEMNKKISEACEEDAKGNYEAAEYKLAEAEVLENVAENASAITSIPKVDGISKSKSWVIKSIDSSEVPVEVAGMEIRPVNEKLVLQLIKASKGTIKIPGIVYEETSTISIRAK